MAAARRSQTIAYRERWNSCSHSSRLPSVVRGLTGAPRATRGRRGRNTHVVAVPCGEATSADAPPMVSRFSDRNVAVRWAWSRAFTEPAGGYGKRNDGPIGADRRAGAHDRPTSMPTRLWPSPHPSGRWWLRQLDRDHDRGQQASRGASTKPPQLRDGTSDLPRRPASALNCSERARTVISAPTIPHPTARKDNFWPPPEEGKKA